jgi:hypothetical protein
MWHGGATARGVPLTPSARHDHRSVGRMRFDGIVLYGDMCPLPCAFRAAPQRRPGTQRRVNADHAGQCCDLSRKTPRNLAIWRLDTESWHAGSVP